MNIKELVQHIVNKEDGKSKVTIGDVREIVGIISDLFYIEEKVQVIKPTWKTLIENGKRRDKSKK